MKLSDILITPLRRIDTLGGDVLHAMKIGDEGYAGFGEAYFTWVSSGTVKAWKRHTRMSMNLVVPVGHIRLVFCLVCADGSEQFRVEDIGVDRYSRITVPPGIWFGFQGLKATESLMLNIANISHDPTEVERLTLADINYVWN